MVCYVPIVLLCLFRLLVCELFPLNGKLYLCFACPDSDSLFFSSFISLVCYVPFVLFIQIVSFVLLRLFGTSPSMDNYF